MKLLELADENWNQWEKKRFLDDRTKTATDRFDPESFKHHGFDDTERYADVYVPGLVEDTRITAELNNFLPPRIGELNNSPYQALVIRYGILRFLIQQANYSTDKPTLLEGVQQWQRQLLQLFSQETFEDNDDLLHLAKAAIDYQNDIDDSELHMIYSYFQLHNEVCERKHEYYTWKDFFERLSSISRFPKVSRSEKPAHAIDTIEKGLWSLQEQAIVFEVSPTTGEHLVGIPEEYAQSIRDWLCYEMSHENYLSMLGELPPFDKQSNLMRARTIFGIDTPTKGRNQKRRESIVEAGVFPSELLVEILTKDELKEIVDRYSLNAHKNKSDEMVQAIVEYFEQSQKAVSGDDSEAELFLKCYDDISDGTVDQLPPQLHDGSSGKRHSAKLEALFEQATADIFRDVFDLNETTLLGHAASGTVADGEIEQNGKWLLWDNKRRAGEFKLNAGTQSKIESYIDTKNQQHDVEWFLVIAPDFSEQAQNNAMALEMKLGTEIRLVRAADFRRLAEYWQDNFGDSNNELPLSIFYGAGLLDLEVVKNGLNSQFA